MWFVLSLAPQQTQQWNIRLPECSRCIKTRKQLHQCNIRFAQSSLSTQISCKHRSAVTKLYRLLGLLLLLFHYSDHTYFNCLFQPLQQWISWSFGYPFVCLHNWLNIACCNCHHVRPLSRPRFFQDSQHLKPPCTTYLQALSLWS